MWGRCGVPSDVHAGACLIGATGMRARARSLEDRTTGHPDKGAGGCPCGLGLKVHNAVREGNGMGSIEVGDRVRLILDKEVGPDSR